MAFVLPLMTPQGQRDVQMIPSKASNGAIRSWIAHAMAFLVRGIREWLTMELKRFGLHICADHGEYYN